MICEVTNLKKKIIQECRGAGRGYAGGNTTPAWRKTTAPARPDHGGDPRPLRFSLLVARGLVCSRVGDGAEETEMKEISCERSRQAVREWFCRSKAILHY